jgi:phosphatidylglycerophosphatase C
VDGRTVKKLVLIDFDGTITTHELLPVFLHYAVPTWRLLIAKPLLMPFVIAMRAGWFSGSRLRAMLAFAAFRSVREADFLASCTAFARDVIPLHVRAEMMARIAEHQSDGDTVVVVSGAYAAYLQPWCNQHGLQLIASHLAVRDGRLTGFYQGPQNVNVEKAQRVRTQFNLTAYSEIHAHGDTHEDRDLLALGHRRWYRGREVRAEEAIYF